MNCVFTEERDEYDDEVDRMREANLQTRQVQAKEEYTEAVKTLEECRKNLAYAKEQVLNKPNQLLIGVLGHLACQYFHKNMC